MASDLVRLAALAAIIIPIFAAPTPETHHIKIRNPLAADVNPDSYIVVYESTANATAIGSHIASATSLLSRRDVAGTGATYDLPRLKVYQATAEAAIIADIAASPEVCISSLKFPFQFLNDEKSNR